MKRGLGGTLASFVGVSCAAGTAESVWQTFQTRDGLANNTVVAITQDHHGIAGHQRQSAVYICYLQTDGSVVTRKMVLLR